MSICILVIIPLRVSNLGHYLVKSLSLDSFDPLLLIEIIDWQALVLQCEEEEHHLVDLLLEELDLLVFLAQLQSHFLLLFNQIDSSLCDGYCLQLLKRFAT